jgi:dolichol-phosphate mannosyltransferase
MAEQKSPCSSLIAPAKDVHFDDPITTPIVANIAVVIPAYRATAHIMGVIDAIPSQVWRIYVVDDRCPEKSGDFVAERSRDTRVVVLRNEVNLGVGGAMMRGYVQAAAEGANEFNFLIKNGWTGEGSVGNPNGVTGYVEQK